MAEFLSSIVVEVFSHWYMYLSGCVSLTIDCFALAILRSLAGLVTHVVLAVPCGTSEHERILGRCSPASPKFDGMTLWWSLLANVKMILLWLG
jgi:hypothetical protein